MKTVRLENTSTKGIGRGLHVRRVYFKAIALLLIAIVLGISGADAQLERQSRDYYDVVFVTPEVGWLRGQGILHTADGGRSWTLQRSDRNPDANNALPLQMQFLDARQGWVLDDKSQLHRTTDGGQTWQIIEVRPRDPNAQYLTDLSRFLMVSPSVGFGLNHSGDLFLRTGDGGLTWRTSLIREERSAFRELAFLDAKQGWVAGVFGAVYTTRDGGQTWQPLPKSPVDGPQQIQFLSANTGWLLDDGTFHLFRTTDGGQSWQLCSAETPVPKIQGFFFRTPVTGWAAAENGILLRTTDGCLTWQRIQTPASVSLNAIHFVDDTTGWAVGYQDTVLKTTDGGQTWVPVPVTLP